MKKHIYSVGNFDKDVEKASEGLVALVEKHKLGEYIESQEYSFEDDPITEVVRYIAHYYDVM